MSAVCLHCAERPATCGPTSAEYCGECFHLRTLFQAAGKPVPAMTDEMRAGVRELLDAENSKVAET